MCKNNTFAQDSYRSILFLEEKALAHTLDPSLSFSLLADPFGYPFNHCREYFLKIEFFIRLTQASTLCEDQGLVLGYRG